MSNSFGSADDDAALADILDIPEILSTLHMHIGASRLEGMTGARNQFELLSWSIGLVRPTRNQESRLRMLFYMVLRLRRLFPLLDPQDWFGKPRPELRGRSVQDVLQFNRASTEDDEIRALAFLSIEQQRLHPPRTEGE